MPGPASKRYRDWRTDVQARTSSVEVELLEAIARGSEEALSRLYDRYSRLVYGLIRAILKDPRDAEEILQEVFLQIWKDAGRFDRRKGNVYSWLVTLARSRAIDRTRSKNYTRRREMETTLAHPEDQSAASQTSQLDAVLMIERADTVRGLLARIPSEQQKVMRLAYFLGHTQSEIASQLAIPLGTVKTRMRQGLMALHGMLAQELKP